MLQTAVAITGFVMLGLAGWIFTQIDFLIPYKRLLFRVHGEHILAFGVLASLNILALVSWLLSKMTLMQSGRHLQHAQKQISDGSMLDSLTTEE